MVCLNRKLPINVFIMKKEIISILNGIVEESLEHIDFINDGKKEKIKSNIIKEFKNEIDRDFFIYRIIDEEHCIHKYRKGNKEGEFCGKKIKTTLGLDEKKDFLCCKHSKKHIPKRKTKSKKADIISKTTNNSLIINNYEKNKENNNINNKINKNIYKYNKINKMYLYNRKNYIKKNVNSSVNSSLISLNNISILQNNIVCNSFNLFTNKCKNIDKYGFCDFKHLNNNINIFDFIK